VNECKPLLTGGYRFQWGHFERVEQALSQKKSRQRVRTPAH